ncbi:MAG: HAMP domain-containing histidine kinase [Ignavibacteria bacterium]|nr:HAMP domain-containing histidine kinase [Ignavibacteria bacterium]
MHCDIAENSTVYGDKERLTQVMTNLLENAIKYNVDGGDVYVSTKHVDTTLRISVRDTGIGI